MSALFDAWLACTLAVLFFGQKSGKPLLDVLAAAFFGLIGAGISVAITMELEKLKPKGWKTWHIVAAVLAALTGLYFIIR